MRLSSKKNREFNENYRNNRRKKGSLSRNLNFKEKCRNKERNKLKKWKSGKG
jgi:hypothetical protein